MLERYLFCAVISTLVISIIFTLATTRRNEQKKARLALDDAFAKKHKALKLSAKDWT